MCVTELLRDDQVTAILARLLCDEPCRATPLINALRRFLEHFSTEDGINGTEPRCIYQDLNALNDIVTEWLDGEGQCMWALVSCGQECELPRIDRDYDL